jgi:integrase
VFLRAFLATGARPAELLALTPANLTGTVLHLRTLKHGPERRVELDPTLARSLLAALPFQKDGYRRFWRTVRDESGLSNVRLYDIRHTAASEMLRRGMTLREVQRILGHSSSRMTERYAHFAKSYRPPKALSW